MSQIARLQQVRAPIMVRVVAVQVATSGPVSTISIALPEFGADDLPCPRAQVRAGTAEDPQDLETAPRRLHQLQRMLTQLLGLVRFQAVDEFVKVAVIMCCGHKPRLRQSRADGLYQCAVP